MAAPRELSRYLEQQVEAYFPRSGDGAGRGFNIFKPTSVIRAGSIKTMRHFIFPIKTYKKMDADPLNSLLMSYPN